MTVLRIGAPPRRPRHVRRAVVLAVLWLAVTILAVLVAAATVGKLAGWAPVDMADWLIGLVAVVGLVWSATNPWQGPTRRRTSRPGTPRATRRAHYSSLSAGVTLAGRPPVSVPPRTT
jgi:hypothetical protein